MCKAGDRVTLTGVVTAVDELSRVSPNGLLLVEVDGGIAGRAALWVSPLQVERMDYVTSDVDVLEVESCVTGFSDASSGGWGRWSWADASLGVRVPGLGVVSLVEESVVDGESGSMFLVLSVKFDDGVIRFFKKCGYTDSWDGSSWDGDFSEVTPVEVMVTRYESV